MEKKFPIFKTLTLLVMFVLGMGSAFAANCAADYVAPENPVWDGTSTQEPCTIDGYYIIDNAAKLAWYAKNYKNGNAKLTADLDLDGKLWTPIAAGKGGGGNEYANIFDGNGHIIKNLYVNAYELATIKKDYAQNIGFVGVLGGGTIKNLTLENVVIQASTNAGEVITGNGAQDHQISVGAFVGWMSDVGNSVVENCMATGTIRTTGSGQGVGGIVGNAKKGTITNCLSLVEIMASGSKADIGGIIGITKSSVSVTSCVYAGPGLTNTGSNGSVGGIAGNVVSGKLTTESDYYEGETLNGVGKYCTNCLEKDQMTEVDVSNIEDVTCALNGKNTDGTCKTEPWAVGETSLSLNGYGTDGYKIVFYANGGEYADGSDAKNKFFNVGMAINADGIVPPSDEENTFIGWASTSDATAPAENLGTVSKSDTVFAVWQPKLTLTFDVSPGVFPDDNVQVKAKRVDKGGLVTVGSLGTLPTSYCKKPSSSGDGCDELLYFTGWARNSNATESDTIHLDDFTTEDDLTLYAVWTVDTTYTVTYNANGHGKTRIDYVRVKNGNTIENPQVPVAHDGYVFAGKWFTKSSCEETSEFDFKTPITESIVLYAKWNPQTYTITYDIGDGVNAEGNPSEYNIETETITLKAPTPAEGKAFDGWYNDSKKVTKIAKGSFGNKTLYAKWVTKTYRIIYLADNNSYGAISDQFKEHGKSVVLESEGHFSRTGYTQDGWTSSIGGDRVYVLGAFYSANADITLYPHWVQGLEVVQYGAVTVYTYADGHKEAVVNDGYTGTDPVNIPEAIQVDRIIINRTFTPNTPSTIMLPFTLPEGTKFNGARFYDLKSVVQIEGKYAWKATLAFIGSKHLPVANKPYGVKCENSTLEIDLNGGKATLQPAQTDESNSVYYEVSGGDWRFVGAYAYKKWQSGDVELDERLAYALTAKATSSGLKPGDFGRVTAKNYIYPMRAYIRKKDNSVQLVGGPQTVRASGATYGLNNIGSEIIEVEFVDDEKTTAIGRMNTVTGEIKIDRWFDLKGRHVKNVNRAAKGAYYGKKVFHE